MLCLDCFAQKTSQDDSETKESNITIRIYHHSKKQYTLLPLTTHTPTSLFPQKNLIKFRILGLKQKFTKLQKYFQMKLSLSFISLIRTQLITKIASYTITPSRMISEQFSLCSLI